MQPRLRLTILRYTARPPAVPAETASPSPPRHGLVVRIADDAGRVGQGEAAPFEGLCHDTLSQAAEALEDARHAIGALDLRDEDSEQLTELVERLRAGSPSAAFAAETAFLDMAGQRNRRPLAALLDPNSRPRPVQVNALIVSADPDAALREAADAVSHGIRVLKLKIRRKPGFEAECTLLSALRAALPAGVGLRLDVNGAWSLAEAERRLPALAAFEPEYVEQPVAPGDLEQLSDSPVPLAADESLQVDGAEKALFAAGNCSVFVLKPMVLGGLCRCLEIARRAARAGIASVVTHTFDGVIARAAAAHLASVLPGRRLACGLADHPALAAWPVVDWPCVRNGFIPPPRGPGLGIPVLEPPR